MNPRSRFVNAALLSHLCKWTVLAMGVAVLAGSASAFFLFALDWATRTREANPWLLWGLPFAGFAVGWVYLKVGQSVTWNGDFGTHPLGAKGGDTPTPITNTATMLWAMR